MIHLSVRVKCHYTKTTFVLWKSNFRFCATEYGILIRSGGRQAWTVQMTYGVKSVSERESTMDFRNAMR